MSTYERAKMLAGQFTYTLNGDPKVPSGVILVDTATRAIVMSTADYRSPEPDCK